MRPPIPSLLVAIALSAGASAALAAEIRGKVVRVDDGDTLTVLAERREVRIRLESIDAPELGQPFGKPARKSLATLCAGKQARVTNVARDASAAATGRVYCGRTDAGAHQVKTGMAWVYVRYADPNSPLYRLEYEARLKRLGLWSDVHATAPWDWRQRASASRNW
jgi:endonuclease YncB( thermonuclease family)